MKIISLKRAREIASYWRGGQWSALYQFASSGVYLKENHLRYLKETQECREPEFRLIPGTISKKHDNELKSLIRFFEVKGHDVGLKTIWGKHNVYGYKIPYLNKPNPEVKKLNLFI